MPVSKYDLLFQQWKASLPSRDGGKDAVQVNFEELFQTLKADELDFEGAYAVLPKAIKAHLPQPSYVKNAWKKWKHLNKWSSEKELEEEWHRDIENKAEAAFFNVYPVETKAAPKVVEKTEPAPAFYGNMSAQEYKQLREHADSFPKFDFDALEKERQEVIKSGLTETDLAALLSKEDNEPK